MKAKITKFYNDNFSENQPQILLPTTRMFFYVDEGKKYSGDFDICSKDERSIRGTIYSSSSRMKCSAYGFDDTNFKVNFTFDSAGLKTGDIYRGELIIMSTAGEYKIEYVANILAYHVNTVIGKVSNLKEFIDLYMYDHNEAYKIFKSSSFKSIISQENVVTNNIYDNIKKNLIQERLLEEFLIGIGKKKRIKFMLENPTKTYQNISSNVSDSFAFKKAGWGFSDIQVTTDSDFIELSTENYTTDDFKENVLNIEYYIKYSMLNKGKNEGVIKIVTPYESFEYKIIVRFNKNSADIKRNITIKKNTIALINHYLQFETSQITGNELVEKTKPIINQLSITAENDAIIQLARAYFYACAGRNHDASDILSQYNHRYKARDNSPTLKCFYKFILGKINDTLSNKIKIADDIKEAYNRDSSNPLLLWLYLRTDQYLIQNAEQRLSIIERNSEEGISHFLLMLDAYNIISSQPDLIEPITDYKINVLLFATRRLSVDRNFIDRISSIISKATKYNEKVFEILKYCYEINNSVDALRSIVRYLIAGNKRDEKYFIWFEKGVKEDLHIANLFEYYMYSIDEKKPIALHEHIYLYFGRSNQLGVRKKAFLYSNIIKDAAKFPEILEKMEPEMNLFALEQLKKRVIDRNLKNVYKYFAPKWNLSRQESDALSDLIYSREIVVEDDNIANVIIVYNDIARPSVIRVENGLAYATLYTDKDKILLQDKQGNIYINTIPYTVNQMLSVDNFREQLHLSTTHHIGTLINICDNTKIDGDTLRLFELLSDMEQAKEETKRRIKKQLLWYYFENGMQSKLEASLQEISIDWFDSNELNQLIIILIKEDQIKRVENIIEAYGSDNIMPDNLLDYANKQIQTDIKQNDKLLNICFDILLKDKYSDDTLKYMCEYYSGSIDNMHYLWDKAQESEVDTKSLEERYLIQSLFCERVMEEEDIFYNYYIKGGNNNIITAYLSYKSNEYFSKNKIIDDRFFEYLETEYARHNQINLSCKLAFLKYYSARELANDTVKQMVIEFLIECRANGLNFDFFDKFKKVPQINLSTNNVTLIQYQSKNNSKLTIYYKIEDDNNHTDNYIKENMPMFYNNYYQKEFVLFNNEVLSYYIVEEVGEKSSIVEVKRIIIKNKDTEIKNGKYSMINNIISSDNKSMIIDDYERKNYLAGQMFQVL